MTAKLTVSELLAASTALHWELARAEERGDATAKIKLRAEFSLVRAEIELRRREIDEYLSRLTGK